MAEPTAEMNYGSGSATFGNGNIVKVTAAGGVIEAATANDTSTIGVVVRGAADFLSQTTGTGGQVWPNIVLFGNAVLETTEIGSGGTNDVAPVPGAAVGIGINANTNRPCWCAISGSVTDAVPGAYCLELNNNAVDDTGVTAPTRVIILK
jgi:hypothetical protein